MAQERRLRKTLIIFASIFLVSVLMWFTITHLRLHAESTDGRQVAEAIFRYDLDHWGKLGHTVLFTVEGHDPDEALLKSLAAIDPRAKKGSRGYIRKVPLELYDKDTEQTAVEFDIRSMTRRSGTLFKASGGYYCGGLCAAGGTYTVRKANGRWFVESFEMDWIS